MVKVISKHSMLIVLTWKNSFVGPSNVPFGKISLTLSLTSDVIVTLSLVAVNDSCFVRATKTKAFSSGRLKGTSQ